MSEAKRRQASSLESQCYTRAAPGYLLVSAHWSLRVYRQQRTQGLGHMYDWISILLLSHTQNLGPLKDYIISERTDWKKNLPTIKGDKKTRPSSIQDLTLSSDLHGEKENKIIKTPLTIHNHSLCTLQVWVQIYTASSVPETPSQKMKAAPGQQRPATPGEAKAKCLWRSTPSTQAPQVPYRRRAVKQRSPSKRHKTHEEL